MGLSKVEYSAIDLSDTSYVGPDVTALEESRSFRNKFSKDELKNKSQRLLAKVSYEIKSPYGSSLWHPTRWDLRKKCVEAIEDAKTLRWRHYSWRLFAPFGIIALLAFLITGLVMLPGIVSDEQQVVCMTDGSFLVSDQQFNIWAASGMFQITFAFGQLQFSQAKAIDLAFDIVVGRIGQLILGLITYRVYTKALGRMMEVASISYATFEAITLESGTIFALLKLGRDLLKNPAVRVKAIISMMIINALYLMAYPSLTSALSGYTANILAYVQTDNGTMVVFSDFNPVRYIIHDGDRLGGNFTKDHVVVSLSDSTQDPLTFYDQCQNNYKPDAAYVTYLNSSQQTAIQAQNPWQGAVVQSPDCLFMWHVSNYTSYYGFLGLNGTASEFNNSGLMVQLPSPALNISAYFNFIDDGSYNSSSDQALETVGLAAPYGYYWQNPFTQQIWGDNVSNSLWYEERSGEIYGLSDINSRGVCQQVNGSYQWGFSFLLLYITLVLSLMWTISMYALYLDSFLYSRLDAAGKDMGLQRAVLEISSSFHENLEDDVKTAHSNRRILNDVQKNLEGGRMSYQHVLRRDDRQQFPPSRWVQLKEWWANFKVLKWVKEELCWIVSWDMSVLLWIFSICLPDTGISVSSATILFVGSSTVLIIGSQARSRWVVAVAAIILALVFITVGPYNSQAYWDGFQWGLEGE